jgi:uncharacterized protein YkwD
MANYASMGYKLLPRCSVILKLIVLLSLVASAQTVRIQGQDLPYHLVDGRQMISRALLAQAFPGFADGQGEVDLRELINDPQARVLKREGVIVSVRYYSDAMAALYEASRKPASELATRPSAGQATSANSYQAIMDEVVRLSNLERQTHGAPPLSVDKFLEKAAASHSEEMARLNYFDHTSPTPGRETPDVRIRLAGSNATKTGENLAMFSNFPEPELAERAVTGWMNSPGHRRNLLDPSFTHIGIGIAKGTNAQYYITQNFSAY